MKNISLPLRLLIFVMIIFGLALISIYYPEFNANVIYEKEEVFVLRVIDGDTIETSSGRIRLLGVNTPEKGQAYSEEAKDFLGNFVNESVEILRDVEDLDKYERKLRYVFYDGQLINSLILERGLGTSFMLDDLNYESKLIRAEEQGMANEENLWAISNEECAECIVLLELNAEEEFFVLENICSYDCLLNGWSVKDDANHIVKLERIDAGGIVRYDSNGRVWNNAGDRFFMRDGVGGLVIFYEY